MKKMKIFLSCLLALIFTLSVPVVSKATVYDGYIGSNYYKCTVNGSTSNLYSKIKYDASGNLKVELTAAVYYRFMGRDYFSKNINREKTATSTSVTYSKTYLEIYNEADPVIPANGFFQQCTYNSRIGSTTVIYGVLEVFQAVED